MIQLMPFYELGLFVVILQFVFFRSSSLLCLLDIPTHGSRGTLVSPEPPPDAIAACRPVLSPELQGIRTTGCLVDHDLDIVHEATIAARQAIPLHDGPEPA
jgi:hypothetical protein